MIKFSYRCDLKPLRKIPVLALMLVGLIAAAQPALALSPLSGTYRMQWADKWGEFAYSATDRQVVTKYRNAKDPNSALNLNISTEISTGSKPGAENILRIRAPATGPILNWPMITVQTIKNGELSTSPEMPTKLRVPSMVHNTSSPGALMKAVKWVPITGEAGDHSTSS